MLNKLFSITRTPIFSIIQRSLRILSRKDKFKLVILAVSQVLLSLLDLIGVILIGIIGTLAVSGSAVSKPGSRILKLLEFLRIEQLSIQYQVAIIGTLAAFILITKTLFSIYFSRKTLFFLSVRSANVTKHLVAKLLNQSLLQIQKRSLQENVYMITGGVGNIISGILGTLSVILADLALVVVMIIGLFLIDPTVSILTILIFGGILSLLYILLQKKSSQLGGRQTSLSVRNSELIQEVFGSYREAVVSGKRAFYVNQIGANQIKLAINNAKLTFLPSISKYVLEITVVLGTLVISGLQFVKNDSARAVTILSIFFAASTRIVPALLRIQQGLIYIKGVSAASTSTLEMLESTTGFDEIIINKPFSTNHFGFRSDINLTNVFLRYEGNEKLAMDDVSISIENGTSVALVGKSGAGKTSFVDVLLGVIEPTKGTITISGFSPIESIDKWPGAISYLPQNPKIINGTIRENICTGYDINEISDELIWSALRTAHLENLVLSYSDKLDTYIGDQGNKLSGGEKQRLGIARAVITQPKLLVMDEGTSSLDSLTELEITKAITELKKETTIILIAHRLSSVKSMDKIVYIEKGKILSIGNFDEVRAKIPDFSEQSKLLGL
jgi:ABC-type multidrug transport system fused ATPase/permease subunit